MTQAERVLVLLAVRGAEGVTVDDFPRGFRLAARIADLRSAGNPITTKTSILPGGARIACYQLAATTSAPAPMAGTQESLPL